MVYMYQLYRENMRFAFQEHTHKLLQKLLFKQTKKN